MTLFDILQYIRSKNCKKKIVIKKGICSTTFRVIIILSTFTNKNIKQGECSNLICIISFSINHVPIRRVEELVVPDPIASTSTEFGHWL